MLSPARWIARVHTASGIRPPPVELEEEIAGEIGRALVAGDANAQALRGEIAAVLEEIDAGGTVLRAAIDTGNERVRSDVIAAIGVLGTGFAEMGFLIKDVARAAAEIQKSLDEQGANVRAIIDQNARQSTEIRLVREDLAVIARRTRAGVPGDATGGDQRPRWVHGCPYRGLLPFDEADAEVFYGRERLTAELAVKLAAQAARSGLVVVTGASGAGKSSLLRAGLLPALARGVQVRGIRALAPLGDHADQGSADRAGHPPGSTRRRRHRCGPGWTRPAPRPGASGRPAGGPRRRCPAQRRAAGVR